MRATRKFAAGHLWPAGQGLRTAAIDPSATTLSAMFIPRQMLTVAPGENLTFRGQCQCVAVGALGRRHLLDDMRHLKGQPLRLRLAARVSQSEPAVAAFTAAVHAAIRLDEKRTELASLHLKESGQKIRSRTVNKCSSSARLSFMVSLCRIFFVL